MSVCVIEWNGRPPGEQRWHPSGGDIRVPPAPLRQRDPVEKGKKERPFWRTARHNWIGQFPRVKTSLRPTDRSILTDSSNLFESFGKKVHDMWLDLKAKSLSVDVRRPSDVGTQTRTVPLSVSSRDGLLSPLISCPPVSVSGSPISRRWVIGNNILLCLSQATSSPTGDYRRLQRKPAGFPIKPTR